MSLLLNAAVEEFTVANSDLTCSSTTPIERTDETVVSTAGILMHATKQQALQHPSREWTCIPLHEPDDPALTSEYVGYYNHDLRGHLFAVYDPSEELDKSLVAAREDSIAYLSQEDFEQTTLARRVRYWHPDNVPSSYPDYFEAPVQSTEEPRRTIEEVQEFFDAVHEQIRLEQEYVRNRQAEQAEQHSARQIFEEGDDAIPRVSFVRRRDSGFQFTIPTGVLEDARQSAGLTEDAAPEDAVRYGCGIHEGNDVLLHIESDISLEESASIDVDEFPIPANLSTLRGRRIELHFHDRKAQSSVAALVEDRDTAVTFGVSLLVNTLPFERRHEAVDLVADSRWEQVLTGQTSLTFTQTINDSGPFDTALNQAQQEAVAAALAADDVLTIHGPPGTGKTRTLIEIVRRSVAAGDRVLVTAPSNQAVDNIVVGTSTDQEPDPRSLHSYGQYGEEEFDLTREQAYRSDRDLVQKRYSNQDPEGYDVVAATTNRSAQFDPSIFDVAVVDEATQASFGDALIPMTRANRAILAGDHKQLPPFTARINEIRNQTSTPLSVLEHLYASGGVFEDIGVQLVSQYRMHQDIVAFPNRVFYDHSLRNAREIPAYENIDAVQGFNVGGEEITTKNASLKNPTEARLVTKLIRDRLLATNASPEDIAVITPYSGQVTAVRETLQSALGDTGADITVDTIDSFQGSEKPAIILTLVRSNSDSSLGFLGDPVDAPRRLNVAMTRAERYCGIIGDWHTLRQHGEGNSLTDDQLTLYNNLYQDLDDRGLMTPVFTDFIPEFNSNTN